MREREPATAVAIVAAASALRGSGGGPMPPGLLQPFMPIVLVVGRFAADWVVRIGWLLLLLAPAVLGAGNGGLIAGTILWEEQTEAPRAGGTALLLGLAALVSLSLLYPLGWTEPVRRIGERRIDRVDRWIARATALIKTGAGPHERRAGLGFFQRISRFQF